MAEWPTLPRGELVPWPGINPRRRFTDEEIEELRESLRENGMLQPVGVTLQEEPPHFIYAGERRWRASEGVLEELPVIIREIDEPTAQRLALIENIQREDLSAIEEAEGLNRYLETSGLSQRAVATEIGKTQGWISNRVRLLQLDERVTDLVMDGVISASQARDLILPFASIPEEKWTELNKGVATRLRKKAKELDRSLVDEEVRLEVTAVATAMSGWLEEFMWNADNDKGYPTWLRLPEDRWDSAPKGSIVRYRYGRYTGATKTARAFDDEWWDSAMKEYEAEAQKGRDAVQNGVDEPTDLEWTPDMGPIPASVELPYHQTRIVLAPVVRGFYQQNLLSRALLAECPYAIGADPSEIPPMFLVLRAGEGARPDQVLCTDAATFEKAQQALIEKRDAMIEKKRQQRDLRQMEAATQISLEEHLPELVAMGYDIDFVGEPALEGAAAALGHTFPAEWDPEEEDPAPWMVRIAAWLHGMPQAEREDLLKLAVVRSLAAAGPHPRTEAETALAKMLTAELAKTVDFDLPTPPTTEEEK